MYRSSHVTVSNIAVANSPGVGILGLESDHVTVSACSTYNTFSSGTSAWDCTSHTIENCRIVLACNKGAQECISISRTHHYRVIGNEISNTTRESNQSGGEGIDCKEGSSHGVVANNYLHHLERQALYLDSWRDSLCDVELYGNVVHDCLSGFAISTEVEGGSVSDVRFHHNVIYNCYMSGVWITTWGSFDGPRRNIRVCNNTVALNGWRRSAEGWPHGGIYIETENTEKLDLRNNLLHDNCSFQINPGDKCGLVGPNGAGKTTLLRMIAGEVRPDGGAISVQNSVRMAYFSQTVGEMRGRTALAEVIAGNARVSELAARLREHEERLSDPDIGPDEMTAVLERMGEEQTEFEKLGGFDIESNARVVLSGLGVHPRDHDKPVEDFSSGWKMRIALARVLIVMPDLVLMDEPTNYLDMETIIWLEEWLRAFRGAVLMTTHDRDFMNRVVTRIVEVAGGAVTCFSGNYDFYEQEKALRRRQNEAAYERQQSMLKKTETFIERYKARASHAALVQSRVNMLDKIERVELDREQDGMRILLPEIPRGGNDVVVIRGLGKSWSDSRGNPVPVFAGLDGELTVFQQVQRRIPPEINDAGLRNLLASFLFTGDDIHKKVRVLSGGEKARVVLAYLFSNPYNCLVLDEPTNHLDIRSREILMDTLERYQGTVLLVSHDRYLLRKLTKRVFEVDRGRITVYEGDYAYYLGEKGSGISKV